MIRGFRLGRIVNKDAHKFKSSDIDCAILSEIQMFIYDIDELNTRTCTKKKALESLRFQGILRWQRYMK